MNANMHESEDKYGNPTDGSRLIYCCFPDCGCDGARLCMAENGASSGSLMLNLERGESASAKRRDAMRRHIPKVGTIKRIVLGGIGTTSRMGKILSIDDDEGGAMVKWVEYPSLRPEWVAFDDLAE